MTSISQHNGLYTLQPLARPASGSTPSKTGQVQSQRSTVELSQDGAKAENFTYTKTGATKAKTQDADFSAAFRELTPLNAHPKALAASKTFLDIAHYDSGIHLLDVYA